MLKHFRRVLDLFDRRTRVRVAALGVCVVGMALLETVGVASILPFMSVVSDPAAVTENRWLALAYEWSGLQSREEFLFLAGVVVLVLITVSNAFTAFTNWMLLRFTWAANHDISTRLLGQYLSEPYAFYLDRNTANLSKTLLAEVTVVITGVVIPAMRILASSVVALFLFVLLVTIDPLLATVVGLVLGGAYGSIYAIIRRRQSMLGRSRLAANGARFQVTAEAFGGIKEVKVLGRERDFLARFEDPSREFSNASASNAMVSQLPRYALETVAFGGILLIVLYLMRTRTDLSQILPIVSLYAFAGYRMMPALQQIFSGASTVRFNSPALERLHEDLVRTRPSGRRRHLPPAVDAPRDELQFDRRIRFEQVCFRYPKSTEPALDEIDLTIERNTTLGLAGATGSGKTTLVDLLLGLHLPEGGDILVDDIPLSGDNVHLWRRRIGYVPQSIFLCDDTIIRNIAFGLPEADIDMEAVEAAAETAHLDGFIQTLPAGYRTIVGERGVRLSGGQRQRIGIARALYHNPDVLVMDEATSALDTVTENAVMSAIRDLAGQKTIILIAHRLTTLRECDNIVVLQNGRILDQGTYGVLSSASHLFRAMTGEHGKQVGSSE